MAVGYPGDPRHFDPEPFRRKGQDPTPEAAHRGWLTTLVLTAGVLILLVIWVLLRFI